MKKRQKQSSQNLVKDIAKTLELAPEKVNLAKLGQEHHKKPRFVYGFTTPSVRNGKKIPAGFFKVSGSKHAKQIKRESLAMQIANEQLNVPTVGIISPTKKCLVAA